MLAGIVLATGLPGGAFGWDDPPPCTTHHVDVLLLAAGRDEVEMRQKAVTIASQLGWTPHLETGAEAPPSAALEWETLGVYLSVHRSDYFSGFTPGLWVVVGAAGKRGDTKLVGWLEQAKAKIPDAYIKSAAVEQCWMLE